MFLYLNKYTVYREREIKKKGKCLKENCKQRQKIRGITKKGRSYQSDSIVSQFVSQLLLLLVCCCCSDLSSFRASRVGRQTNRQTGGSNFLLPIEWTAAVAVAEVLSTWLHAVRCRRDMHADTSSCTKGKINEKATIKLTEANLFLLSATHPFQYIKWPWKKSSVCLPSRVWSSNYFLLSDWWKGNWNMPKTAFLPRSEELRIERERKREGREASRAKVCQVLISSFPSPLFSFFLMSVF